MKVAVPILLAFAGTVLAQEEGEMPLSDEAVSGDVAPEVSPGAAESENPAEARLPSVPEMIANLPPRFAEDATPELLEEVIENLIQSLEVVNVPIDPSLPEDATPFEFNGNTYYLIPLKQE